jgi:hypothetical protein
MKLFGLEIKRKEKPLSSGRMTACYGCGKQFFLYSNKVRVMNYCSQCAPKVI